MKASFTKQDSKDISKPMIFLQVICIYVMF